MCSDSQYKKADCGTDKDTECVDAPTYNTIEVQTGKDCTQSNGTKISAADYASDSTWSFTFTGAGGVEALGSGGTVAAPCEDAACDKKSGTINAQQKVADGKLTAPAKVSVAVEGSKNGWCVSSICISSSTAGTKAYQWTGNQWMNPGSDGPDAGAASSWSLDLKAVDSCGGGAAATATETKDDAVEQVADDTAADDTAADDTADSTAAGDVAESSATSVPKGDELRNEAAELAHMSNEIDAPVEELEEFA